MVWSFWFAGNAGLAVPGNTQAFIQIERQVSLN